jgi:hypothetical protein
MVTDTGVYVCGRATAVFYAVASQWRWLRKVGKEWICSESWFKQQFFYEDSVVNGKNRILMYLTNFLEVRQVYHSF